MKRKPCLHCNRPFWLKDPTIKWRSFRGSGQYGYIRTHFVLPVSIRQYSDSDPREINSMNCSLKNLVLNLIDNYLTAEKMGSDFITEERNFHPMAEGKFLSTFAELLKHGLVERGVFEKRVDESVEILNQHNLSPVKENALFGLGFQWLDRPAEEPYLITSAICTLGLLDAAEYYQSDALQEMLNKSLNGLCHWIENDNVEVNGKSLPAYSPHVRIPCYNPAAHCCATLLKATRLGFINQNQSKRFDEIFEIVESARNPNIGWNYSATRMVSDLVHINYISRLYFEKFSPEEAEAIYMPIMGQHYSDNTLYERTRLIPDYDSTKLGRGSFANCSVRRCGDKWFTVDSDKARLWAIGELLVNASYLASHGKHKWYWKNMINNVLTNFQTYESDLFKEERTFFRASTHIAHGLACAIPFVEETTEIGTMEKLLLGHFL